VGQAVAGEAGARGERGHRAPVGRAAADRARRRARGTCCLGTKRRPAGTRSAGT